MMVGWIDLVVPAICMNNWSNSGVISKGAQEGGASLAKITDHFGGAQPP